MKNLSTHQKIMNQIISKSIIDKNKYISISEKKNWKYVLGEIIVGISFLVAMGAIYIIALALN